MKKRKAVLAESAKGKGSGRLPSFSVLHLKARGPLVEERSLRSLITGEGVTRTLIKRLKDAKLTVN